MHPLRRRRLRRRAGVAGCGLLVLCAVVGCHSASDDRGSGSPVGRFVFGVRVQPHATSLRSWNSIAVVEVGRRACALLDEGQSPLRVARTLAHSTQRYALDDGAAYAIVRSARDSLCPGRP